MKTRHGSGHTLAAGAIGNFIEIYDFAVFGFSVPILALHFFPGSDRTAALLSTFAAYAVALFARPIGGLVFGFMADRVGRIKVLAATVWLMASGTALIGLLPTYEQLGIAAPILLVLFRIAQGVALGGETTGSAAYIIESAADSRRGWWVGISYFFGYIANAFVGVLLTLQVAVGREAYVDWVWRVPFLAGGVLGVVGFWLRRNLEDPDEFVEASRSAGAKNLASTATSSGLKGMVYVLLLMPILATASYLLLGFMYTFLVTQVRLAPLAALLSNAVGIMTMAVFIPISGALSDRFGRKKVLWIGAAWIALSAYPALVLASSGTFRGALIGQAVLAVGVGLYGGAALTAMLEVFPTVYRGRGHAISYQLGVAIFGGSTPFIGTLLVSRLGSPLAPGVYVAVVGAVALAAIQFVPETKGVRLRTSVETSMRKPDESVAHELP